MQVLIVECILSHDTERFLVQIHCISKTVTRRKAYANQSGSDTEPLQDFTKFVLIHKNFISKFNFSINLGFSRNF